MGWFDEMISQLSQAASVFLLCGGGVIFPFVAIGLLISAIKDLNHGDSFGAGCSLFWALFALVILILGVNGLLKADFF